ncbi:low temperature requirement protein A [Streptomyces polyrhachis]|uniref:Low temperature requirement protein A n=1 Tax=Streptomyces polyrhachis TaxID=1282885 RepID=A0ABW2GMZ6_9ACTN
MTSNSARHRMTATDAAHRVTSGELFFDLVFVCAITQVTALMAADPTWLRLFGAAVVLALLWWCWSCFAWLGNVVRADSGPLFGVLIAVMSIVMVTSLVVPEVYEDKAGGVPAALVFVLCYGSVRLLHLASYWVAHPGDAALRAVLRRTALISVLPPFVLLLAGSQLHGRAQVLVWLGAVAIDYLGIYVTGSSGWRVNSAGHFAERHGLIVIIALGESLVAIGVGAAGYAVTGAVLAAGVAGVLVAAGLWLLYFRRVAEPVEERLASLEGDARTTLARDAYTFLHLPLIAGVVLTALGVESVLHQAADSGHYDLAEPLHGVQAWALTGGVGLFLLGTAAILLRVGARRPTALLVAGALCLPAGLLVALVPALLALGLLTLVVPAALLLHRRAGRRAPAQG